MARSNATTVEEYLQELPPERREVITAVRDEILRNLPEGYVERMNWGMISYEVPLETYPDTYNGQPLMMAALAAQKNNYSVYLTSPFMRPGGEEEIRQRWREAGYPLDMGKSCIRFKRLEQLPLAEIGREIRAADLDGFIRGYEEARAQ